MPNLKHGIQGNKHSQLQVTGIVVLLLLAALLLWFNHVNSTQAIPATVAQVRFYGEYRIGDGQWLEITEGSFSPS